MRNATIFIVLSILLLGLSNLFAQTPTGINVTKSTDSLHVITWVDAEGLTGEYYNVYYSKSKITQINPIDNPNGVFRIATGIPEGTQKYNYELFDFRPPSSVNYYYAVTVVSGGVENTTVVEGVNSTANSTPGKTLYAVPIYYYSHGFPATIDGDLSEYRDREPPMIYASAEPGKNYVFPSGGITNKNDCSWEGYFVMDNDAIYFAGCITDDKMFPPPTGMGMWTGDTYETFIGLYHLKSHLRKDRHGAIVDTDTTDGICQTAASNTYWPGCTGEPDYQFGLAYGANGTNDTLGTYTTFWGQTNTGGALRNAVFATYDASAEETVPGWHYEVKIPFIDFKRNETYPLFRPKLGMVIPIDVQIDDDDQGDANRDGALCWSVNNVLDISWNNPKAWWHAVIYHETAVIDLTSVDSGNKTEKSNLSFSLSQNYPNPFNPQTTIRYAITGEAKNVNLSIYNISGQLVRTLVNETKTPGSYSVVWDGRNDKGLSLPSGIYMYSLTADGITTTKRMVMMK